MKKLLLVIIAVEALIIIHLLNRHNELYDAMKEWEYNPVHKGKIVGHDLSYRYVLSEDN